MNKLQMFLEWLCIIGILLCSTGIFYIEGKIWKNATLSKLFSILKSNVGKLGIELILAIIIIILAILMVIIYKKGDIH